MQVNTKRTKRIKKWIKRRRKYA